MKATLLVALAAALTATVRGSEPAFVDCAVSFAAQCRIESTVTAGAKTWYVVEGPRTGASAIIVALDHESGTLQLPGGELPLTNVRAVTRSNDGDLVIAEEIRFSESQRSLGFFTMHPAEPSARRVTRSMRLAEKESLVAFMPSAPDLVLTTHRIGSAIDDSADRQLSEPLVSLRNDRVSCDRVGNRVIIASPRTKGAWSHMYEAKIVSVHVASGRVEPVRPRLRNSDKPADAPREPVDDVTGILADPREPSWYYIARGDRDSGGSLWRCDADDLCDVAFESQPSDISRIAGLPWHSKQLPPTPVVGTEPILAVARNEQQVVGLMTVRGVYELDQRRAPRFIGAPEFQQVGGFYVATNVAGWVVALDRHASEDLQTINWRARVWLAAGR